jgi:hypothetical protein
MIICYIVRFLWKILKTLLNHCAWLYGAMLYAMLTFCLFLLSRKIVPFRKKMLTDPRATIRSKSCNNWTRQQTGLSPNNTIYNKFGKFTQIYKFPDQNHLNKMSFLTSQNYAYLVEHSVGLHVCISLDTKIAGNAKWTNKIVCIIGLSIGIDSNFLGDYRDNRHVRVNALSYSAPC